jgi:putative Holliday junction resolvase
MRILAIDYGDRRLGLAISDPTGLIASGLPTIERSGPKEDVTDHLRRICQEQGVERIIVGLPINMDGSRGPRAEVSEQFAQALREELDMEVETWDERLTTAQAERAMLAADLSRKKRKKRRDQVAAQILLQSYLDAHRQT